MERILRAWVEVGAALPPCCSDATDALVRRQHGSKADVRSGVFEQHGDATVAFDPRPDPWRNPTGHIKNALVIVEQAPRKDRLMMGDPIPQRPQIVQRLVGLLARQGCAMRKRSTKRWPPECSLVVRLPVPVVEATSAAKHRNPESERERSHNPRWSRCVASAPHLRLRGANPIAASHVESGRRIVVPRRTVAPCELPVHGVPQSHLQTLQWTVERGAYGRVPRIEMKCPLLVARGGKVRAHAFRRERRLQLVQDGSCVGGALDSSPVSQYCHRCTPRVRLCLRVCARGSVFLAAPRGVWPDPERGYPGLATAFRLAFASSFTARKSGSSFFKRSTSPERS